MRTPENKKIGTVYLIHFDQAYHHARHYLGFTELAMNERLRRHKGGNGAKLLRAVRDAGIGFDVVKTWENAPQTFEIELKNRKHASRFCPVCVNGREVAA